MRTQSERDEAETMKRRRKGRASPTPAWALGLLAIFLAFSSLAPASAQPLVEEMAGYVDFERFGSFDLDDLKVEINLGGSLLNLLSGAVEAEDDEFSKLLKSLKLIKVNVFELPAGARAAADRMNETVKDLRRQGWESIVRIRQEEEIHILIRSDEELILGLLATWADDSGNVGMVNIVGDFDPAQIARLARQLDIGPLEDVDLDALDPEQDR